MTMSFEVRRELLSYAETAEMLGCSPRTLRRDVERGEVPKPVKRPGRVRFVRVEIEEHLRRLKDRSER